MTRAIPSELLTALTQNSVEPYYALEMLFDDLDGTSYDDAGYQGERAVRFWTGFGLKTINSETFIGSGGLLSISGLESSADLSAKGATLTLSGINDTLIELALQEPYQSRMARVYLGEKSVSSTVEVFSGLMDVMSIRKSGESSTISLSVESTLVTLQRAKVRRYTSENHKLRYPSDTFFDYVAHLADASIQWGPK